MASQRFSFKYGKEQLSLSIEHARSIRVLEGAPLSPLGDLPQAYLDARLVCRPDSDWLRVDTAGRPEELDD